MKRIIVDNLKAKIKATRTANLGVNWLEFSEISVDYDIEGIKIRFSRCIRDDRAANLKTNQYSYEMMVIWEKLNDFHLRFDTDLMFGYGKATYPFIEAESIRSKETEKYSGQTNVSEDKFFPYDAGNNNENFNELMSLINQLNKLNGK